MNMFEWLAVHCCVLENSNIRTISDFRRNVLAVKYVQIVIKTISMTALEI